MEQLLLHKITLTHGKRETTIRRRCKRVRLHVLRCQSPETRRKCHENLIYERLCKLYRANKLFYIGNIKNAEPNYPNDRFHAETLIPKW